MYPETNFISALLAEPFCDLAEEYEELLTDWYGDDLALFDIYDEDLCQAVRKLQSVTRLCWTATYPQMTSYEKLRCKYEALLNVHSCLIEAYGNLSDENEKLGKTCRDSRKKILKLKSIADAAQLRKGGCD